METLRQGWYSLIQYVPDPMRGEGINVGVVLLCPDLGFLDACMVTSHSRLKRMLGREHFDARADHWLKTAETALRGRLRSTLSPIVTLADLERFVATLANDLWLTPPRLVVGSDPELVLNDLMATLVEAPAATAPILPLVSLARQQLTGLFHRLAGEGRARVKSTVEVPVTGETLRVPYAYQNGALNLVKPELFPATEGRALTTAMKLALTGDLLHRHPSPDGPRRLIVVAEFAPAVGADEVANRVADLFAEYPVRLILPDEVPAFIDEIEAQAH